MGMTSNPTIFEKAITGSKDYADILESPEAKQLDAKGVYEKIAIRDVQDATDIFKPVYQQSKRRDGYVETVFGRRLYLPEIRSRNRQLQQLAETIAPEYGLYGYAGTFAPYEGLTVNFAEAVQSAGPSSLTRSRSSAPGEIRL